MMTFYLKEKKDGRVVLDLVLAEDEAILQTIEARTWCDARAKVNENALYHNPGYGWFKR